MYAKQALFVWDWRYLSITLASLDLIEWIFCGTEDCGVNESTIFSSSPQLHSSRHQHHYNNSFPIASQLIADQNAYKSIDTMLWRLEFRGLMQNRQRVIRLTTQCYFYSVNITIYENSSMMSNDSQLAIDIAMNLMVERIAGNGLNGLNPTVVANRWHWNWFLW